MDSEKNHHSALTLPAAIIIAGAIIAIAIIWTQKPASNPAAVRDAASQTADINLAPVTATDHILGNPNAEIKIVEFSDPSCPFCKTFHPIMKQIMGEYGPGGKVAWVYRAYPLDKPDNTGFVLHPNAGHESEALECAAALGGNEKFWAYANRLYEITPSVTSQTPAGLDQKQLPVIAKFAGLDVVAFNDCLASGRTKDAVEKDYLDGVNAGVSGTPYSILILGKPANQSVDNFIANALLQYRLPTETLRLNGNRTKIVVGGAMPYALVSKLIDTILGN